VSNNTLQRLLTNEYEFTLNSVSIAFSLVVKEIAVIVLFNVMCTFHKLFIFLTEQ